MNNYWFLFLIFIYSNEQWEEKKNTLPSLWSWCSCFFPWFSVFISVSWSSCNFSWLWSCVSLNWISRSCISESKLFLSEDERCSRTLFGCCSSWKESSFHTLKEYGRFFKRCKFTCLNWFKLWITCHLHF